MNTVPPPRDLRELTSIRFFAALYVILFHAYDSLPALYSWDSGLIRNGYLGVDLFFILSGMILTHVNIDRVEAGTFRFGHFIVHRLARIYPLNLAMFLAFVAFYAVASRAGLLADAEGRNWDFALQHLTLLHAWGTTDAHAWNGPSWSISAEFFAYLCFPLCLFLIALLRPLIGLGLAIALMAVFWVLSPLIDGKQLTQRSFDLGILRIIPEFLIGIFLYLALRQLQGSGRVPPGLPRLLLVPTGALFFMLAHLDLADLVLITCLTLLLSVLGLCAMNAPDNPMRHSILVYLGEISYSTYMVHYIFLVAAGGLSLLLFGSNAFPLWYWLIVIAVIYPASSISYHLIELPARHAIRALLDRSSNAV